MGPYYGIGAVTFDGRSALRGFWLGVEAYAIAPKQLRRTSLPRAGKLILASRLEAR